MMLTRDSRTTAEAIARRLGIDAVEAEALPQRKVEVVNGHQAEGHIVTIAGDGANDAPALAQADLGIAMGTGTDVAISCRTGVKDVITSVAPSRSFFLGGFCTTPRSWTASSDEGRHLQLAMMLKYFSTNWLGRRFG